MLNIIMFAMIAIITFVLLIIQPLKLAKGCGRKLKLEVFILHDSLLILILYAVASLVLIRDADGHFFAMTYGEGAVFYDVDHKKYIWQESLWDDDLNNSNELVSELDNTVRLDPYNTYVNLDGEIVLEEASLYTHTRNNKVLLSEDGEKRYTLLSVDRNVFGRLRFPESKGFKMNDSLIAPVTYEIDMEYYELSGIQKIIDDEYNILLAGLLIISILWFFEFLYKSSKNDRTEAYLKVRRSVICILTVAFFRVAYIMSRSLTTMLVMILVPLIVGFLSAAFLDGLFRSMSEEYLFKNEEELSVLKCISLSTPEGVKSVRRMVIGINVLLTANWLLVIIAVCFNW